MASPAPRTPTRTAAKPSPTDKSDETAAGAAEAPERDGPLLDLSDQAVKKLIKAGKARGYVTFDELNAVLPAEESSSEKIEDIMAMFSEMGVNVVEQEEEDDGADTPEEAAPDEEESRALAPQAAVPARAEAKAEPSERTDDPVRMYLREMGSVELLSREGEIAIAKRIEAGHEAMIAGLCESPLTFQAIIIWRDELNEGKVLLRDIIDLEATYAGPEAKAVPAVVLPAEPTHHGSQRIIPPPRNHDVEGEEGATPPEGEGDDEDDFDNALSGRDGSRVEAEGSGNLRQHRLQL